MSFLADQINLKRVELSKELYIKHRVEIIDMLTTQYIKKDPISYSVNYETLFKYFQDEYNEIFTSDKSYLAGFLYFEEDGTLAGNFMLRDTYLTCKSHKKVLEKLIPTDNFYDFYLHFIKHTNEVFSQYNIKEGDSIYGTNLAFSAKYLEKFKGKKVLKLIFAMFADLSEFWQKNLREYKFGIWVQMRQSLMTITAQVFDIVEGRPFAFMGDDKIMHEDGKLFLVKRKDFEEIKKYWNLLKQE